MIQRAEGYVDFPERETGHTAAQRRYAASDKGRNNRLANRQQTDHERNLTRPFIAWDGEGINAGIGKPQNYVLFGSSTDDRVISSDGETLTFSDCAELILTVGRANPGAWHVGFAFDYDVNEIIRTLPRPNLKILKERKFCKFGDYRLEWYPHKWFRVSKHTAGKTQSVKIYDIWSFFSCSFVKALCKHFCDDPKHTGPHSYEVINFIEAGKKRRQEFALSDLQDEIVPYWEAELTTMVELISHFRDLLYLADLPITSWHGPGAIASLVLKRHNIKAHEEIPRDEVLTAAQYAYSGGRFEQFKVGRCCGHVWSCDVNSAYPDTIAELPSLKGGTWVLRQIGKVGTEIQAGDIKRFAIYRVSLDHPIYKLPFAPAPPGPLFYRSDKGETLYPWYIASGWYWGPEVENLVGCPWATIHEVWDFIPANDEKPFAFINTMYQDRQQWKKEGRPEQLALKLAMNSIYGKFAQRVGWETSGKIPQFHQLEWAGYVTSSLRANLWRQMMALHETGDLIAIETDGIYTTRDPATIGIVNSEDLGGWTVTRYDEVIYLQSGMYFKRTDDNWEAAYRGLDPDSIRVQDAISYLESLGDGSHPKWDKLEGRTTRFIGLAAAMTRSHGNAKRFRELHCTWVQGGDKDITIGKGHKRAHFPAFCKMCKAGIPVAERAHPMCIPNIHDARNPSGIHDLPWRRDAIPAWREAHAEQLSLIDPNQF